MPDKNVSVVLKLKNELSTSLNGASVKLKQFGTRMKQMGGSLSKIGGKLTTRLTLPIAALGTIAVKSLVDFNEKLARVQTLLTGLEDPTKRIIELRKQTQILSIEMGKNTNDMATGLFEVISAFGDSEESMGRLRAAAKASVAGNSSVIDSVKLLSAVTKGYGDTSESALSKVSDLAFKTNELGQTTFPELAASMGRVVPFAAALGVSQEELFATFATLTGVAGDTNEVSTQMRGVLSSLVKPSEDLTKTIEELGFESGIAMVKQLGVVDSLKTLNKAVGGNKEEIAKLFPNVRAVNAVFALTGSQASVFAEKLQKMKDAVGATDKAFKAQKEGINKAGASWKQLQIQIQVLAQNFGALLLPIFSKGVEKLQKLVSWVSNLSEKNKKLAIKFAAIAAAAGPVLIIVGKFIGAIGVLSTAIGGGIGILSKFVGIIGSLGAILAANPIGALVIAIAGLGIGLGLLIRKLTSTEAKTNDLFKRTSKLKKLHEEYVGTIAQLKDETKSLTLEESNLLEMRKMSLKTQIIDQTETLIKRYEKLRKRAPEIRNILKNEEKTLKQFKENIAKQIEDVGLIRTPIGKMTREEAQRVAAQKEKRIKELEELKKKKAEIGEGREPKERKKREMAIAANIEKEKGSLIALRRSIQEAGMPTGGELLQTSHGLLSREAALKVIEDKEKKMEKRQAVLKELEEVERRTFENIQRIRSEGIIPEDQMGLFFGKRVLESEKAFREKEVEMELKELGSALRENTKKRQEEKIQVEVKVQAEEDTSALVGKVKTQTQLTQVQVLNESLFGRTFPAFAGS